MARIRTIKPEFFTSEDIFGLTPLARLFYVSLWCEADREGRLEWKLGTLKARYLPADSCDISALAQELSDKGLIVIYEVDGKKYAEIPTFTEHQVINNREAQSKIPARERDASLTRESAVKAEGKGKEGNGKEGNTTTDACAPEAVGGGDGLSVDPIDPVDPDPDAPKTAPLPPPQDLPAPANPAVAITVALRPLRVSAMSTNPVVMAWADRGISIEILIEAVRIARESKGDETISPQYLAPIVDRLLNPPADRRSAPRGSQSQKFHFADVDRSADVALMNAGLAARGVTQADLDDDSPL